MRGNQNPRGFGDGANGGGKPLPRPLLRPSPSANLVGNWKGDPLGPQVAAPSGLPNRKLSCARALQGRSMTGAAGRAVHSPPRRDEDIAPDPQLASTQQDHIGDGL